MNDNETLGTGAKRDPRTLELRGRPQHVTRFRRPIVIGLAGLGAAALFGLAWWALNPLRIAPVRVGEDLLQDGSGADAESLRALPDSYDDFVPPPELGPPLPGDLGPPLLAQERALGLAPERGFDPDTEAARAERLRLAQQARQAREAGVFFQLVQGQEEAAVGPEAQVAMAGSDVAPSADLRLDPELDPSYQQRKLAFLNRSAEAEIYNPHALQAPVSPYQVMAGAIIPASLITGVNSDLPGRVLAQVTEDVYDTATGRYRLIPQGTRLLGSYDSLVAYGQSRALIVWERLILPDGRSLRIDNLPAADTEGHAGLADAVDFHTWSLVKGIVLSTLLDAGSALTLSGAESELLRALGRGAQENVERAGEGIVRRQLDVQPTITLRPGSPLRIIVHKDLILEPYESPGR